jgi:hypothetical protein
MPALAALHCRHFPHELELRRRATLRYLYRVNVAPQSTPSASTANSHQQMPSVDCKRSISFLAKTVPLCGLLWLLGCGTDAAAQTPAPSPKPTAPTATTKTEAAPRKLSAVPPPEYQDPINGSPLPSNSTSRDPQFGGRVFSDPDFEFVRPYEVPTYSDWTPQLLPEGLIYRSYLAGAKESRMSTVFNYMDGWGGIWDITLGGRIGLFRFGTTNGVRPEGFQIDIEGSGQPRLDLNSNEDLIAADFRAGLPITYGVGPWQMKLGYYHLSSHAGDEYMVSHPTFQRINYARDVLLFGQSYYVTDALRIYGEAGWAFYHDISKAWEFQFGADYSPLNPSGFYNSAPFFAVNGALRQELNFGGNFVVQAGRQWRGGVGGQTLRIGLQYYNGGSNEFEFYSNFENKVGIGIWYDY